MRLSSAVSRFKAPNISESFGVETSTKDPQCGSPTGRSGAVPSG